MNKIAKMLIVAVLLFTSSQMFAQTDFYLNLGGSFPVGDFADGDENSFALVNKSTEGGAGIGFTAGMKLKFNTKVKGLGVILTLDGIYNGLNSDIKEMLGESYDDHYDSDDITLRTSKYINVPLMVGANYTYNISEKIGIYGEAGLGANFRYITNLSFEIEDYGDEYTETIKYDPAFSFAFQVGAGIEINERIAIGVNYCNLGNGKVAGKVKYEETYGGSHYSDSESFKCKSVAPSMIMLRVGFKF